MEVRWLEQTAADVRSASDWLSAGEAERVVAMRIPKRREDWLLGRWTAKHAVTAYLELPNDPAGLATLEIRPAASGAPEAFVYNRPAPVSISLSHREGRAACAIADPGITLGCDLEVVEPRCAAFVTDYFTPQEQELVARASSDRERFRVLALLWSAKESTLKALRTGLRLDTREIAVDLDELSANSLVAHVPSKDELPSSTWHPMKTRFKQQAFVGWWQCDGDFVRTMVSVPASPMPIAINIDTQCSRQPAGGHLF